MANANPTPTGGQGLPPSQQPGASSSAASPAHSQATPPGLPPGTPPVAAAAAAPTPHPAPTPEELFAARAILQDMATDMDRKRLQADAAFQATEKREADLIKKLENAADRAGARFIKPVSDELRKVIDAHVYHANARVTDAQEAAKAQAASFSKQLADLEAKRSEEASAMAFKYWISVGVLACALCGLGFCTYQLYQRTTPESIFLVWDKEYFTRHPQK